MAVAIVRGDARALPLPDGCVDLIVTSPPYFGLRSYTDGGEHYGGQIGSEATPGEWLASLVACTAEMVRVLKPEGSIFINLGDKYNSAASGQKGNVVHPSKRGTKWPNDPQGRRYPLIDGTREKSLLGLPWRYALAATDQLGLILRRDIIWAKPNGLPESVTDRCRSSHEYVFHLVKQPRYYAAVDEIREPYSPLTVRTYPTSYDVPGTSRHGRNSPSLRLADNPLGKLPGSVWTIPSQPLVVPGHVGVDHFAAFPVELPRRIVLGWSPPGICEACGQGRRPVVDKQVSDTQRTTENHSSMSRGTATLRGVGRKALEVIPCGYDVTVIGYACACPTPGAPTRPAVVLDPFAGTGTTLLAAAAYGRHAIGIDRSADYCRLATWRVHDPAERAKALHVPKPPPIPEGQDALFAIDGT